MLGTSLAGAARRPTGHQSAFPRPRQHPSLRGRQSPSPTHLRAEFADAQIVAATSLCWATEVGYHNALRTTWVTRVSESAAAVYITRTFLEHFANGIVALRILS